MKREFLNYKQLSKDEFSTLNEDDREYIQFLVAYFHYRDGKRHNDGSMGTIDITPGEFRDILAFCIKKERE